MIVGVVTGFIPLPVKHVSEEKYHELGLKMLKAAHGIIDHSHVGGGAIKDCWSYNLCTGRPPANPVPPDRYATPEINVMSHIVQHQRTTWALQAKDDFPSVDVWAWFDYGLMKQGDWTGKPIRAENIQRFLRKLQAMKSFDHIPFPGITDKHRVFPTGNVWRFCGSTHIWPTKFIEKINVAYKTTLREWISLLGTVPLDLPIWAMVEQKYPELPFRWYPAEYDATQLDNLPGETHDPAL